MSKLSRGVAPVAILTLALSAIGMPSASAADPVAIDIVSINDFHGRLEAAAPAAGAAVLGGMVNSYRAANPNTAFVAAGDLIGASTFTSFIQQDQPTIDALNEIGLDVSSLGNHELDLGRADFDDRVQAEADWDYIAANLYDTTSGVSAFQEYSLQQFGDVTVGFVGAVTDELPTLVSPAGIATLNVRPVVPEVNRVADQLSDGNEANGEADVVILLVHEGAVAPTVAAATDSSTRFGQIVNGANANVDAIISGHTHLAYDFDLPVPGTDRTRPVYSSGQYGEKYGHLSLSVDPTTGAILSISAQVLTLTGFTPDPEVAAIVASAVAVATVEGRVKVGDITADFNRGVRPAGAGENRGAESTLGNFVADVQLWATEDVGAQIAFMNPGGLRSDLKYSPNPLIPGDVNGAVAYQEAAGVQPFANTLVTLDLTGAQIKAVLEQQWQPAGASRPILHLGVSENLKYTYDPTAAAGNRIRSIYIDGVLVQPTDVFRAVANSFLTSGGDNFTAFVGGTNKADSGRIDLASMVDYFVENPVASPDYVQRSVGVQVSAADADGYSAGDVVTLTLSSLLFSQDGPRAGTAVVSAGGVQLGSAPIDPTIVDLSDEVGRAVVTITIPADTRAGILPLTVSVPETGTSIVVPLTTTFIPAPITSVTAPAISGTAKVGRTLSASGGTWSVDSPSLSYQWLRNGVAISGATNPTYRLVVADAGASITVAVTASNVDFVDATATSTAKVVAKLDSSTSASAPLLARFGSPVTVSTTVRAEGGVTATGSVTVYDGRRVVATGVLGSNGKLSVTVTGLSRGIHIITVQYGGSAQVDSSTSFPQLLIVW